MSRQLMIPAADTQLNAVDTVFATTPHKHTQILSKAPDTVVAAVGDVIHRSR